MRLITIVLAYLLGTFFLGAQMLYTKSYGSSKNTPIIFLHGGPSGNSTLFESTTAQNLSNIGYFLIVYDRRCNPPVIRTGYKYTNVNLILHCLSRNGNELC
jgi:proline iminopeptidase